mmetsp:Transcript_6517/g.13175  ORF Transcript_6517/g.13175 Transcript_6517/m.13175 type:complete len:939 (-) Transcript_6517:331-3147(-)
MSSSSNADHVDLVLDDDDDDDGVEEVVAIESDDEDVESINDNGFYSAELQQLKDEVDYLRKHSTRAYDERDLPSSPSTEVSILFSEVLALYARTRESRTRVTQQGPFPEDCKVTAQLWQACEDHLQKLTSLKEEAETAESLQRSLNGVTGGMATYVSLQDQIRKFSNPDEADPKGVFGLSSLTSTEDSTDAVDLDQENDSDSSSDLAGKTGSLRVATLVMDPSRSNTPSDLSANKARDITVKRLLMQRKKARREVLDSMRQVMVTSQNKFDIVDSMAKRLSVSINELQSLENALDSASQTVEGKDARIPSGTDTTTFKGCIRLRDWVLKQKRMWDSENDFTALQERSDKSFARIQAHNQIGSMIFSMTDDFACKIQADAMQAKDDLSIELSTLKKSFLGSGLLENLPLKSMQEAISRIRIYCKGLLQRASQLRSAWSAKKKEVTSFEEASKDCRSRAVIKDLYKKLQSLDRLICEKQRKVDDLTFAIRTSEASGTTQGQTDEQLEDEEDDEDGNHRAGTSGCSPNETALVVKQKQSNEQALQEELDAAEADLKTTKDSSQNELKSLLEKIIDERGDLIEQARKHFPELLFDHAWIREVDEVCHPETFRYLNWAPVRDMIPLSLLIPAKECNICGDTTALSDGVQCNSGHFMCKSCLEGHVRSISQVGNDIRLREANGEIPCYDPQCKAPPIPSVDVLKLVSKEAFSNFMAAVKRSVEEDTVTTMHSELERKRKIMEEEIQRSGSLSARVDKHFQTITDDILTLKCPQGKHAFSEFTGCFALTCTRCRPKSTFCGWCLSDTGADAHAHVAYCPMNLNNKNNRRNAAQYAAGRNGQPDPNGYYGTKDMFEEAQRKRRKRLLEAYWKDHVRNDSPEVQVELKKKLTPELIGDLNIKLPVTKISGASKRAKKSSSSSSSSSGIESAPFGSLPISDHEPICLD